MTKGERRESKALGKRRKRSAREMLIKKMDKIFSIFIRLRDTDSDGNGSCCTCGRLVHFKSADAGHFHTRSEMSIRWHECNVHLQCKHCNGHKSGNTLRYWSFLRTKYGIFIFDKLSLEMIQDWKFDEIRMSMSITAYQNQVIKMLKGRSFKVNL